MVRCNEYKYVDPGHLNEMANGEDDFILQVIELFLAAMPDNTCMLTETVAGDNYPEIIFYTHKIRGSLNFIGAPQLIDILDKIDELCEAQTGLPEIRILATEVLAISTEIITELHDVKQQLMTASAK